VIGMDDSPIKTIFHRVKTRVEKLESLTSTLGSEIENKRQVRDEWYNWHNLWKKAWFSDSKELSKEEKTKLQNETSVTTRYQALDI
jgi:hypothetical protein